MLIVDVYLSGVSGGRGTRKPYLSKSTDIFPENDPGKGKSRPVEYCLSKVLKYLILIVLKYQHIHTLSHRHTHTRTGMCSVCMDTATENVCLVHELK